MDRECVGGGANDLGDPLLEGGEVVAERVHQGADGVEEEVPDARVLDLTLAAEDALEQRADDRDAAEVEAAEDGVEEAAKQVADEVALAEDSAQETGEDAAEVQAAEDLVDDAPEQVGDEVALVPVEEGVDLGDDLVNGRLPLAVDVGQDLLELAVQVTLAWNAQFMPVCETLEGLVAK